MQTLNTNATVIDAPCGRGKTTYIINYINQHPQERYIYISPLLEMQDRILGINGYEGQGVDVPFAIPNPQHGFGSKLESLKRHMKAGKNICSTHALFTMWDNEAIEIARECGYHLLIDEALECVNVIPLKRSGDEEENETNKRLKSMLSKRDIEFLLERNCIAVDYENYGRLKWIAPPQEEFRYADIYRLTTTGALSLIDQGESLIWHLPVEVFNCFPQIDIFTYRFQNSLMRCYMDFYDLSYRMKTVRREGMDTVLAEFTQDVLFGYEWVDFINICDHARLNAIGQKRGRSCPLSANWYLKATAEQKKVIKNNLENYFRHIVSAPRESVMWTTFKKYEDKIHPKGYTFLEGREPTFVPCSCRATEIYKDRYNLAYVIDRHLPPGLVHFFAQKQICIDEDGWALAELLQWIFRSRIRDSSASDRSINLYLPSERMTALLQGWLGTDGALLRSA